MATKLTREELEKRVQELEKEAYERDRAEQSLLQEKYFSDSIIDSLPGVFYFFDYAGKFIRWNRNWEEVTGYSANEVRERSPLDYFDGEDKEEIARRIGEVFAVGKSTAEAAFKSKSGMKTPYYFTGLRIEIDGENYLGGLGIDISQRINLENDLLKAKDELELRVQERTSELVRANEHLKQEIEDRKAAEKRVQASNALLEAMGEAGSRKEYLTKVSALVLQWTGCKRGGIRIVNENDEVPYEYCIGFSDDFLESEGKLSIYKDNCVCTRVSRQSLEPQDAPYLTRNGSFHCNDTKRLAETLSQNELKNFRGVCIEKGFLSVAVIPLRFENKVIGAIHLCDERPGMVPLPVVDFIETMAALIGEAIHKFTIKDELQQHYNAQEIVNSLLQLSLTEISLEELFSITLQKIISIPWLSVKEAGAIFLLEEDSKNLVMGAQIGLGERFQRECARISIEKCLCGKAAKVGKIVFSDHPKGIVRGKCDQQLPQGHFCLPLKISDQIVGVMSAFTENGTRPTKAEEKFFLVIANALAGIVQRRQLEDALRSKSLYARSLIEASLDPLVTISADGKITDVNKATELVTGISRGRLIGTDFSDYFTEPENAREGYKQVFKEGSVRDYPLSIRHESGSITQVLYNATLYRNESGDVQGIFAAARDITQQRRAEEELQKHAQMLDLANDTIMIFDLDGRINYWNKGAELCYGWTRQEVMARNVHELLKTEFPKPIEHIRTEILASGHWEGNLIHEMRNGLKVTVASRWTLQYDADLHPIAVLEINHDITDKMRAEKELREKSLYARTLIESSLDPLVTISDTGKIMDVNKATELVTGVPRDELIGSDFSDYFTEPDKAREGYRQAFVEGFVRDYPLAIRDHSGSITEVIYNATLYRNESGAVQGVFAAARDVTKLKEIERELREKSLYARSLIEASLDPLVTIRADGKIMDVNKATELVTGRSRDELIGSDFSDYFTEPHRAREGYKRVFLDGSVRDYPLAILHESGNFIDVVYNASLYTNDAGEVQGVFAAARDITQRKRAEEALKQYSERLEEMVETRTKELRNAQEQLIRKERLAVLGQLAGGVGHELRNPLGAIKNAAYFLKMVLENPEEDVQEAVEILEKEVGKSEKIISSLLDFARPKLPLRCKTDIAAVLKEELSRLNIPDNIVLVRRLDDLLPSLIADPDQLGQVFSNVFSNAIQAMPEGGTLSIRSEMSGKDSVAVLISDSGPGIPKENLGKLFEPLFTTKAKGIGLGLPITKSIIDQHGGTIEVQSPPGAGCTVIITLPLHPEE